jgi:hypothetical protein
MSKTSYMIESEFLEAQVEKDVASYLGYISGLFGPRYRLLDSDEGQTGADAELHWKGRAFFMQFKKPEGLKSQGDVALPPKARANEGIPQKIRRFRASNGLDSTPHALCFPLRAKAKTATEFQHNILYSYEKPPNSRAIYVCPTLLTRAEYERAMHPGWFWRFFDVPFRYHDYALHVNHVAQFFEAAPLLRGHATIVPHAKVMASDHYYSFSTHGSDLAFHSPEVVRREVLRLSDFLADELRDAYRSRESLPSASAMARELYGLSREWAGNELPERQDDEPSLPWLRKHGKLLRERFGIRQMVMLYDSSPKER